MFKIYRRFDTDTQPGEGTQRSGAVLANPQSGQQHRSPNGTAAVQERTDVRPVQFSKAERQHQSDLSQKLQQQRQHPPQMKKPVQNSQNQQWRQQEFRQQPQQKSYRQQTQQQSEFHSSQQNNDSKPKQKCNEGEKFVPPKGISGLLQGLLPSAIYDHKTKKIFGLLSAEDLLLLALIFLFLEKDDEDNGIMVLALIFVLVSDYIDLPEISL